MSDTQRIPIEVATDFSMKEHIERPTSLTRAALAALLATVAEAIISDDETVRAAAVAAVSDVLADENIVTSSPADGGIPGDYLFIADKDGRTSDLGVDIYGRPAERTVRALAEKGMLRALLVPGTNEIAIVDDVGTPSAIALDADTGLWSERAYWARVNQDHYHRGAHPPQVYPGNWVDWDQIDSLGNVIAAYRVEESA